MADIFPGLESVYSHQLTNASGEVIFAWARKERIEALITADRDFLGLAKCFGPPPKVIRIERCDFPAKTIEQLIRREALRIQDFAASGRAVLLLRL